MRITCAAVLGLALLLSSCAASADEAVYFRNAGTSLLVDSTETDFDVTSGVIDMGGYTALRVEVAIWGNPCLGSLEIKISTADTPGGTYRTIAFPGSSMGVSCTSTAQSFNYYASGFANYIKVQAVRSGGGVTSITAVRVQPLTGAPTSAVYGTARHGAKLKGVGLSDTSYPVLVGGRYDLSPTASYMISNKVDALGYQYVISVLDGAPSIPQQVTLLADTAQRVTAGGALRIHCTNAAFYRVGDDTVEATTASTPIPADAVEKMVSRHTHISFISATADTVCSASTLDLD